MKMMAVDQNERDGGFSHHTQQWFNSTLGQCLVGFFLLRLPLGLQIMNAYPQAVELPCVRVHGEWNQHRHDHDENSWFGVSAEQRPLATGDRGDAREGHRAQELA
jgi:hypothetical protein